MKIGKSMLAMLLCSGLFIALGMTGCGDDDEVDCAGALGQIQSSNCEADAIAAIGVLRGCLTTCQGDPDPPTCEDACFANFDDNTSSCEPAASILSDECGCQVCGNSFETCILGQDPAADCLTNIVNCLADCVS